MDWMGPWHGPGLEPKPRLPIQSLWGPPERAPPWRMSPLSSVGGEPARGNVSRRLQHIEDNTLQPLQVCWSCLGCMPSCALIACAVLHYCRSLHDFFPYPRYPSTRARILHSPSLASTLVTVPRLYRTGSTRNTVFLDTAQCARWG